MPNAWYRRVGLTESLRSSFSTLLLAMYFQQIHSLRGAHKRRVRWLQFSPKGAKLACADEDGLISVWDVEAGALICTFELEGSISVLAWDLKKAERLFIGLESGIVRVVDGFKVRLNSLLPMALAY